MEDNNTMTVYIIRNLEADGEELYDVPLDTARDLAQQAANLRGETIILECRRGPINLPHTADVELLAEFQPEIMILREGD